MDIQIIHVLLGKANPDRMNGVNKVVNSLATYQTNLGYDVTVWGITKNPVINFPKRNYKTELFHDKFKLKLDPSIKIRLWQLPENTIFHIHGGFILQFYLLVKKLKIYGFNYIYTPHGAYNTVALKRSARKKKLYIQLFEKHIVRNAKSLHFIGQSEITGAEKVFGNERFALIPNGQNIDELHFQFHSIKEKKHPVFGFVGRIDVKTKGLDILVSGFAEFIHKYDSSAQLWIIGDGPELPELRKLVENLNINNQVRFFGSKFGTEKLNIIANMDYLCLTSRNEGLPGVVLEAAGLGVPCIVSKETNMKNYVIENVSGFCLSENSPESLAQIMKLANNSITNKTVEQLKVNAKNMVVNIFNWEEISRRLIKVYES